MGREGDGVEVRPNSIRLAFVLDGKPVRRTLMIEGNVAPPTSANVKYAHRLAREIRDRIRLGTFTMAEYFPASGAGPSPITVATQLDTWVTAQRIEASTRKTYGSVIRFWKEAPADNDGRVLGEMALRSVLHSHILTALASKPLLTGKTVNNYVSVAREAFALAVIDKVLPANPVSDVPRAKHQKEPPDPFDSREAECIIADMVKHYDPQEANYCEFKFFTGLRPSEAIALRWPNVDQTKGEMLIAEARVLGVDKGTKTATARIVKLNSRALAVLQRQRKHTFMAGGAVFHDPGHGKAWADEKAFKKRCWTPCLKRLGMRYRPPYNTRHTYATMMLMADMKPAFCARQMGHSVEVFHSTYARWLDGERDDLEMARLESTIAHSSLEHPRKARDD